MLRFAPVLIAVGLVAQAVLGHAERAIAQVPSPPITPQVTPAVTPQVTPPITPAPTPAPDPDPPPAPPLPPITSNEDLHKVRHGQPLPPAEADILRLEIRLSRRQVVLYRGETMVKTYAIAVGRPGWETPKGTFKVATKIKDPVWISPLQAGVVIPGGDPDNPLGRFWIGFWTDGSNWIGFHGTPNPKSVGTAASHGCIRMYHEDVEDLFNQVNIGTEVKVVQ